jgi:N-methylhydantoinase A
MSRGTKRYTIGVDAGGTFTDIVVLDQRDHVIHNRKIPSQQGGGVLVQAIREMLDPEQQKDVDMIVHGSTVAINTLIQRKGAYTAVLTTRGFRDVLKAARSNRPGPHDLSWDPPPPLVPRRNILPVTERLDPDGNVVIALDEDDVRNAARILKKRGIESVAICFLHSFVNPEHERRAAEIVREECPDMFISVSYEVNPDIREFERLSTTVVNSYLGPRFKEHTFEQADAVRREEASQSFFLAHSGGGVLRAETAAQMPCWVLMGGPAAGVVASCAVGREMGIDHIMTFDMGGTSCDVSLVRDAEPSIATEYQPDVSMPVRRPTVDIVSIGAGGGSIAWIDSGGILRVGPASAGAEPGPACYGRGGEDPTVTDALLYLGYLDADTFLGGEMSVDVAKSEEALREKIATPLGWSTTEAAWAITQIATHNMVDAVRLISVKRGHDPRDFALLAYGGAGPTFCAWVAEAIGINRVIVPSSPGLFSARGLLDLEFRYDLRKLLYRQVNGMSADDIVSVLAGLREEARQHLEEDQVSADDMAFEEWLEMRYFGQVHTLLSVPADMDNPGSPELWRDMFTKRHVEEFGYDLPEDLADVEVAFACVAAKGRIAGSHAPSTNGASAAKPGDAVARVAEVHESGGEKAPVQVYDRSRLGPGFTVEGLAIIEQVDTTTVVPRGWKAATEGANLVLTPTSA